MNTGMVENNEVCTSTPILKKIAEFLPVVCVCTRFLRIETYLYLSKISLVSGTLQKKTYISFLIDDAYIFMYVCKYRHYNVRQLDMIFFVGHFENVLAEVIIVQVTYFGFKRQSKRFLSKHQQYL